MALKERPVLRACNSRVRLRPQSTSGEKLTSSPRWSAVWTPEWPRRFARRGLSALRPPQNTYDADTPAYQLRPGEDSKKRWFDSLTITEPM
jgi:hypothetical protein